MGFHRKLVTGVAVLSTIALAACGSSSGSKTASPSTSASSGGSTVKAGAPVVIAGEGYLSGWDGAADGVNARLKRTNDAGGVDGHKIQFLGLTDNGGSADKSLTNLRQLVQRKKVDAIVPEFPTVMSPAESAFLKQQGVPYFGLGYEAAMCNNNAGFPFDGCGVPGVTKGNQPQLTQNLPKTINATDLKGKTIGLIGNTSNGGQPYLDEFANRSKDLGADVVYGKADVPPSTTNVQAFVDPLLAAKPDMIFVVTDLVSGASIQGTLLANGYKGPIINANAYLPGIIEGQPQLAQALNGSWIVTVQPTPLDNSSASKQLVADFTASGGKITFGSLVAYEATDLYIAMLTKAGGDPKKVISLGDAGFTWGQGEGGFTVKFPAAQSEAAPCSGMVRLLDKKYTSVAAFKCIGS